MQQRRIDHSNVATDACAYGYSSSGLHPYVCACGYRHAGTYAYSHARAYNYTRAGVYADHHAFTGNYGNYARADADDSTYAYS